jgi:flavorubredoxin
MVGNIEEVIKKLIELDLSGKFGAAFGSYGWSGEAVEIIGDYIRNSGMKLIDTSNLIKSTGASELELPLRVQFAPEKELNAKCILAGKTIGEITMGC